MQDVTTVATTTPATHDAVPVRADGLVLHGPMAGTGYQQPPCLVRRGDGQAVQLTPLVFAVLEAVDGTRSWSEIAEVVGDVLQRPLGGEDVRFLADQRLRPAGLLRGADGSEPVADRAAPLLGLRFRLEVTRPDVTGRIAAPFARLFSPVILVPALVAFLATTWWALVGRGVGTAVDDALTSPVLVLGLLGATILSAAFHELGHAAACRYSGARPGAMGAALYLVWPVFYTDVTDSYRLGRAGRLRVDLGGLYFNALFSLAAVGLWWVTGADVVLLVVPIQLMQMLRQMIPLVRFDGYHILADLIGVPDLFARVKPTLGRLLGRGEHGPAVLKPWATAVVAIWVAVVVPSLLALVGLLLWHLPALARTSAEGLATQWAFMVDHLGRGDMARTSLGLVALFTVGVVPLGIVVMLVRMARRTSRGFIAATEDRMALRLGTGALVLVLIASVGPSWWPDAPQARELVGAQGAQGVKVPPGAGPAHVTVSSPDDPGRATSRSPGTAAVAAAARTSLTSTYLAASRAARPTPTTGTPTLAVVRVDEWPFPFPPPADARPGDNVVVAVNTIDDSVLFEMTSSLSWVTEGTMVDATNVAYAAASCTGCSTTAVAFQVVISVGRVDVAVPINEAVAVNHECVDCVTEAVAVQLMVTLQDEPTPEVLAQIEALWAQVAMIEEDLAGQPAPVIHEELTRVREQIVQVVSTGRTGALGEDGSWTEAEAPMEPAVDAEGIGTATDGMVPHVRSGPADPAPSPHQRLAEDVPSVEEPSLAIAETTTPAPVPFGRLPGATDAPAGPAPTEEVAILPEPVSTP